MKSIASSRLATVYASVPLLVIADLSARSREDPHATRPRLQQRSARLGDRGRRPGLARGAGAVDAEHGLGRELQSRRGDRAAADVACSVRALVELLERAQHARLRGL